MPYAPPRSCRNPHCPEPAVRAGWCARHYRAAFSGSQQPMPAGWAALRKRVLRRDRYRCVDCGAPAVTVDHAVPRAWGGTDRTPNLVSVCGHCHDLRTAWMLAQGRRT